MFYQIFICFLMVYIIDTLYPKKELGLIIYLFHPLFLFSDPAIRAQHYWIVRTPRVWSDPPWVFSSSFMLVDFLLNTNKCIVIINCSNLLKTWNFLQISLTWPHTLSSKAFLGGNGVPGYRPKLFRGKLRSNIRQINVHENKVC